MLPHPVNRFIDIHSHFLPGFDDGPECIEQCVETARRYKMLGMDTVVATPHWVRSTGWSPTPEKVFLAVRCLRKALHGAGIHLNIIPGMEISYSTFFEEDVRSSRIIPLGKSGCYLVEFPLGSSSGQLIDHFEQMVSRGGVRVILAHPERCRIFQDDPLLLQRFVAKGVLVQVVIDSLFGGFGKEIQDTGFRFLDQGLVHFLATDSHGRNKRMPPDMNCWSKLESALGREGIQKLCALNPYKMLKGGGLAPFSVKHKVDHQQFSSLKTRKGFVTRLLARICNS